MADVLLGQSCSDFWPVAASVQEREEKKGGSGYSSV